MIETFKMGERNLKNIHIVYIRIQQYVRVCVPALCVHIHVYEQCSYFKESHLKQYNTKGFKIKRWNINTC